MAQVPFIQVAKANIVSNPHPDGAYVQLFRSALTSGIPVNYRASDYCVIGRFAKIPNKDGLFAGRLFLYTEFDESGQWLNTQRMEMASENEINEIVIPADLKPNFRVFNFIFDISDHRLYFEVRNTAGNRIAPRAMGKALQVLFSGLVPDTTVVTVTLQPQRDALEKILALSKISKIIIDVKIPNPDDSTDKEDRIFESMREQNIKEQKHEITSFPGETIQLNSENIELAEVGSENGYVEAHGRDEIGNVKTVSTRDYPMVENIQLDYKDNVIQKIIGYFNL